MPPLELLELSKSWQDWSNLVYISIILAGACLVLLVSTSKERQSKTRKAALVALPVFGVSAIVFLVITMVHYQQVTENVLANELTVLDYLHAQHDFGDSDVKVEHLRHLHSTDYGVTVTEGSLRSTFELSVDEDHSVTLTAENNSLAQDIVTSASN
jgi:hypothetical protein